MTADQDGYLYPVNTNKPPKPIQGRAANGKAATAEDVRALIKKDIDQ